jgi:thiosulfate reductase cytochrome b subunit
MMIQTMRTKIDWSNVKFWTLIAGIVVFTLWNLNNDIKSAGQYKSVACPSLFSIARSSRDTLIVMKNVDVCNDYMMDNLK